MVWCNDYIVHYVLQVTPPLDALVVPVSGGGMISGIAIAAKHLQPGIKIYAAEPVGTNLADMLHKLPGISTLSRLLSTS